MAGLATDEVAVDQLEPHRGELVGYCYRMLGSGAEAEDAVQETMLRGWRAWDRFDGRSTVRSWLYRIATNVCLSSLERRARRAEATATWDESDWKDGDPVRLDPYPDHLLDDLTTPLPGPEATVERAESVELAFVAAVQLLPPRQRAVLLLRDVLGYPAVEVAAMLTTTVAATTSALQRARATLQRERHAGRITREHGAVPLAAEQALVRRFIDAWHAADIASVVATLTDDAVLTMPPLPDRYLGRDAIGAFLGTVPAGGRLDRFRLVPTRANRQPAVAAYLRDGDERDFRAHAVIVLAIEGDAIASIVRFADPGLFARLGIAPALADPMSIAPTG